MDDQVELSDLIESVRLMLDEPSASAMKEFKRRRRRVMANGQNIYRLIEFLSSESLPDQVSLEIASLIYGLVSTFQVNLPLEDLWRVVFPLDLPDPLLPKQSDLLCLIARLIYYSTDDRPFIYTINPDSADVRPIEEWFLCDFLECLDGDRKRQRKSVVDHFSRRFLSDIFAIGFRALHANPTAAIHIIASCLLFGQDVRESKGIANPVHQRMASFFCHPSMWELLYRLSVKLSGKTAENALSAETILARTIQPLRADSQKNKN